MTTETTIYKSISEIGTKNNITFKNVALTETITQNIIDIFNNKYSSQQINETFSDNGIILNIYALYCNYVLNNHELETTYYLMASELNDINAINNLGSMYYNNKNYELAKKYYNKGVALNSGKSMHLLAQIHNIELKYDLMISLFERAIKTGFYESANYLGMHYDVDVKDYAKAILYYNIGMEHNDVFAFINVVLHYKNTEKNYKQMKKYVLLAFEKCSEHNEILKNITFTQAEMYDILTCVSNPSEFVKQKLDVLIGLGYGPVK